MKSNYARRAHFYYASVEEEQRLWVHVHVDRVEEEAGGRHSQAHVHLGDVHGGLCSQRELHVCMTGWRALDGNVAVIHV